MAKDGEHMHYTKSHAWGLWRGTIDTLRAVSEIARGEVAEWFPDEDVALRVVAETGLLRVEGDTFDVVDGLLPSIRNAKDCEIAFQVKAHWTEVVSFRLHSSAPTMWLSVAGSDRTRVEG